jgi:hypothetical protein
MTLAGFDGDADLHVMLNMFWEALDFELPHCVRQTLVPCRGHGSAFAS